MGGCSQRASLPAQPLLDGECSIAMADDWSGSGESSVVARGQIVSAHFDGRRARDDSNFWSSVAASHLASIFATACPLHAWLFLTFALGVSQEMVFTIAFVCVASATVMP